MNYEIINSRKKELGINNAQLAELSGLTLSTVDKITSGANQNPKLGTLKAIAKVICCTLDDFDDEPIRSISPAALDLARKYDRLDQHGQAVISAVADLEVSRTDVIDRSSPEAQANARNLVNEVLATSSRQAKEA